MHWPSRAPRLPAPVAVRSEGARVWMYAVRLRLRAHSLALAIPKHSRLGTIYRPRGLRIRSPRRRDPRRSDLVACAVAYIASGAVFWRMKASPNLPWEFGKYAIIVICGLRSLLVRIRGPMLAILYAGVPDPLVL